MQFDEASMGDKEHYETYWKKTSEKAQGQTVPRGGLREEYILDYLTTGKRVLDIGCGSGALKQFVGDRYDEVHGVDISESALEMARKRGMICQCCNLNSGPLPFEDSYFDTIVTLDVIEHVFDPFHFMRERNRVLRHDGNLILSTPNIGSLKRRMELFFLGRFPLTTDGTFGYDGGHLHYWTPKDITALAGKFGFKVLHITGIGRLRKLKELWPNLLTSGTVFHFRKTDAKFTA